VAQFHAESGPGQFELSTAPADPVRAADDVVLVRVTVRSVAARHGLRVSFAPRPVGDGLGNGAHLHLSPWRSGHNLLGGGNGPYGMAPEGQAVLGRLVGRLDALCAITAPSPASYQRLLPGRWAGAYRCWGWENREAAVRLVAGTTRPGEANLELRSVDATANPYLVVAAVCAAITGTTGVGGEPPGLPDEVTVDPASLPPERQPPRLPASLAEAVDRLADDDLLPALLGSELLGAFLRVRHAEIAKAHPAGR
jgi:glutamine synthetase